ncbi:hypothetical protein [uncultured Cellulomonas sp.]|uniref:hypothetical protein n=1 Tax=uncultured Cellulomonas sp. TaxID=189682 RepID=UPI002607510F|nr:hypothetical protein [uncultured Cellulomonas sp.]
MPVQRRVDWWVTRIGVSAGLAAAAPRLAGALSDRVPLQAALGASAAGLAVCATAREYGRTTPGDWVPLLAQVLFGRDLDADDAAVPASDATERELTTDDGEDDPREGGPGEGGADEGEPDGGGADEGEPDGGDRATLAGGARRAARTVWRLARTLFGLSDLFDERPRGNLLTRAIGKLPVVGIAGGWLDERAGIRKAARRTATLVG